MWADETMMCHIKSRHVVEEGTGVGQKGSPSVRLPREALVCDYRPPHGIKLQTGAPFEGLGPLGWILRGTFPLAPASGGTCVVPTWGGRGRMGVFRQANASLFLAWASCVQCTQYLFLYSLLFCCRLLSSVPVIYKVIYIVIYGTQFL